MTEQCKFYSNYSNIKWLDVVNETINADGTWFGSQPGDDKWENPWVNIGYDNDKNKTPLYISKAFSIAEKYIPNIKLQINQHEYTQVSFKKKKN